jgi:AcrR family transcriptional regulator
LEKFVLVSAPAARRVPAARLRVLETATTLFAREGIRAVGIDRLIRESSVTKATFYKHFGSKDRLIREYLSAASVDALAALDHTFSSSPAPREALLALADTVHDAVRTDNFRGSLFVNAAAEYFDPRHPVRVIIAEHHEAISARITSLLQQLGHPLPGEAADELMVSYVGALAWGHVGDPIAAVIACRRGIERVCDFGAAS